MNTTNRAVPAPESYATFWEPVATDAPIATDAPPARKPADAKDAYLEFVDVTEAEATAPRVERAA